MARKESDWKSRFSRADGSPKPRIIGLSYGEEGTAKTSFWLSAPGPIVVQSFDKGLEGVIEEFQEQKEILVKEYEWAPTEELSKEDAEGIRDEFIADYEAAIQNARTVVWDKETLVWELFRYAEFGAPNDAPRNYPALNQRYRKYLNMAKATDANFGIIQSLKDEWVSKAKSDGSGTKGFNTGKRVPQGFGEAKEIVHVVLSHVRRDGTFYYTVGKSRGPGSPSAQDIEFEIPDKFTAFKEFGQILFPDSADEDWE